MISRTIVGGAAAALVMLSGIEAEARQIGVVQPIGGERYPLAPAIRRGEGVAPFFDGFYLNEDGSVTYSFGFMNRNQEEILEIPVGPNNFVTPEEFNGMQPTYFPPVSYGGFGGRRERGVFAVRVPPGFQGDVVWTLSVNGKTYSVPARTGLAAYELGYTPQAAGSLMPGVKFTENAEWHASREAGVIHGPLRTRVGQPLSIDFWMQDRWAPERTDRRPTAPNFTWWKHQGPVGSEVVFEPATGRAAEAPGGKATTTAIFSMPGEYILRVRVDNHGAGDSSHGNMCCWSNGYVRVIVTE